MTDMDKETEAALRESIKHWEENVAAKKVEDTGVAASDCALCIKFFDDGLCNGCPVKQHTSRVRCKETPFYRAWIAENNWFVNPGSEKAAAAFKAAAQEELDFLKSLLPKEKQS